MSDLALDANGDLDITADAASLVTGADAIRQKLQVRLRMVKGEWFLDERIGVPYYQSILLKNPDLVVVRGLFRKAISACPGVVEITQFSLTVDAATRTARLTFSCLVDGGDTITFDEEFILT